MEEIWWLILSSRFCPSRSSLEMISYKVASSDDLPLRLRLWSHGKLWYSHPTFYPLDFLPLFHWALPHPRRQDLPPLHLALLQCAWSPDFDHWALPLDPIGSHAVTSSNPSSELQPFGWTPGKPISAMQRLAWGGGKSGPNQKSGIWINVTTMWYQSNEGNIAWKAQEGKVAHGKNFSALSFSTTWTDTYLHLDVCTHIY